MTRRPIVRAARLAALAVLACGLITAPVGVGAAAADTPLPSPGSGSAAGEAGPALATFGIGTAAQGVLDERDLITVKAAPGSVIYDTVAVINQSDFPLDIDVYATDALNGDDGSVGLPDRATAPAAAGSWLALESSRVTVPAQSADGLGYVAVPITITIPVDAEPGEHLAGVVASVTAAGAATGGDQTANVNLEQRVGLRVYVTVDGPVVPGLRVSDLRATYEAAGALGLAGPGSATVTYTLTNTGNTRLAVEPTTSVAGPFGMLEVAAAGPSVAELLPRASVTQTVRLPRVWPLVYDRVTVAAAVSTPLAGSDSGLETATATVVLWAVPWTYLALVLLLAALGWWVRRRRARRPPTRGRRVRGRSPSPVPPGAAEGPEVPSADVAGARTTEPAVSTTA